MYLRSQNQSVAEPNFLFLAQCAFNVVLTWNKKKEKDKAAKS